MPLPTKPTPPDRNFYTARTCIVGAPGVGKSTFASKLGKKVIFANLEDGLRGLDVFQYDTIETYATFAKMVEELVNDKHEFTTVAVDVIDRLYKIAELEICRRNKITDISDIKFGGGYAAARGLIMEEFNKLRKKGLGVISITHAKEKEFKGDNLTYTAMASTLSDSYEKELISQCELVFYVSVDANKKRWITTQPSKNIWTAKDRYDLLPYKIEADPVLVMKYLSGELKRDESQVVGPSLPPKPEVKTQTKQTQPTVQ